MMLVRCFLLGEKRFDSLAKIQVNTIEGQKFVVDLPAKMRCELCELKEHTAT